MYRRGGFDDNAIINEMINLERARMDAALRHFLLDEWRAKGSGGATYYLCPVCTKVAYTLSYCWAGSAYMFWDLRFSHGPWDESCGLKVAYRAVQLKQELNHGDRSYKVAWAYSLYDIGNLVENLKAISRRQAT
jgi:hypothetical protein